MSSDANETELGALLLGRYRIEGFLGEGGLGTVVKAFDMQLKRPVAIKTLKRSGDASDLELFRSLEERFAREAEAGSRMGSRPNLVTVYDLVRDEDRTQYLLLEYVSGGTLADRIKRGPLTLTDALRLTTDIADGLHAAHGHGIVHRDVKPANVFVSEDGRAQLGDFGIAQIDDISGRTHAVVGHPGTPLYMSPEQAHSTGYVRASSDQYSLGLVLFEMLTGQAYKRLEDHQVNQALQDLVPPVTKLLHRMLAEKPGDRFPTMNDVVNEVRTIQRWSASTMPEVDRSAARSIAPLDQATIPASPPRQQTPLVNLQPAMPTAEHVSPSARSFANQKMSRRGVLVGVGALTAAAAGAGGALVLTRGRDGHSATEPARATATLASGASAVAALAPIAPTSTAPALLPTVTALPLIPTATLASVPTATSVPPTATMPPAPTVTPMPTTPPLVQPSTTSLRNSRIQQALNSVPAGSSAVFTDLTNDTTISFAPGQSFRSAALIDLFIVTEAYRQIDTGRLHLDDPIPVRQQDVVTGTGVLTKRVGGTATVREMISLVTTESDNVATNILMDRLGIDAINGTIGGLGLRGTLLARHLQDEAARQAGKENLTTAEDMAKFFTKLARGQVISGPISSSLINAIGQQVKPEWDYIGRSLAPRPQIVHMPGTFPPDSNSPGAVHDAGIVYIDSNRGRAYVLAFLSYSSAPTKDLEAAVGKLSSDVYSAVVAG